MDIGPDGKLYFTGTDSKAYRGDIEGNFEMFAEIITGTGFTLGCQFDRAGNYYILYGERRRCLHGSSCLYHGC